MFLWKKTKKNYSRHKNGGDTSYTSRGNSEEVHTDGLEVSSSTTHKLTNGTTNTNPRDFMTGLLKETFQNEENNARAASAKNKSVECSKHPGHKEFIPIHNLEIHNLPQQYQKQDWVRFLQLKGEETVSLSIHYTSPQRPDDFGFANLKGTTTKRIGSGTAFHMQMDNVEECNCSEVSGAHLVSGYFKVMTVAHVVFNDEEAQNTVIKFFYDDENDKSTVVKAWGVRVSHVDIQKNRSVIECRTHDLSLYHRLSNSRQERMQLIQDSLACQVHHDPMVVLISHPHGWSKRVSIGRLLELEEEGQVKTTKDGVDLIGCILTYNTASCLGTGGGSINLIGQGEVCLAFAPHSATKSDGKNISGLGWTKYVKAMTLRG